MQKPLSSFTDLQQFSVYQVSMKHVHQGLDLTEMVPHKSYYRTIEGPFFLVAEKLPVLYFLLLNLGYFSKENQDNIKEINQKVKTMYDNGQLTQNNMLDISLALISGSKNHFSFIEYFIKEKLLDVNVKTKEGYSLLMITSKKSNIDKLIKLGCDIEYKMNNVEYSSAFKNKTVYEYAIKCRKKSLISTYSPYIEDKVIEENHIKTVEAFKKSSPPYGQLSIYKESLKENNLLLIDELYNNQEKYQKIISYIGHNGNDLIMYAVNSNAHEILKKLLTLDHFQSKLAAMSPSTDCYTIHALRKDKGVSAQILYNNGFVNIPKLIDYFKDGNLVNSVFFKKLIDDGYKFDVIARMRNSCIYKIEEENYGLTDIKCFFEEYGSLLNLDNIFKHNSYMSIQNTCGSSKGFSSELKFSHVKLTSRMLKIEEKLDNNSFQSHFETMIKSIGNNTEALGSRFAAILFNDFPEKEKEMLELFSFHGKKDWITKINKENLEKLLNDMSKQDKEEKPRMKI